MTNAPIPTMLWESADPLQVLAQRFRFATPAAAPDWLMATVKRTYGITVTAVDRLVMSSYNLLAWLTTAEGPLLAKCCVFLPAHQRLLTAAELVVWLAQQSLPVSVPLPAQTGPETGAVQVRCDHFSVGVQRIMPGELLDPTAPAQATAAGHTLAQLHQALAVYPQATAFALPSPAQSLAARLDQWVTATLAKVSDPALVAALNMLQQQIKQLRADALTTQLVHGDFRTANILWQANQISALLDLEEVRWGYRVNDLAWATIHLGTRYHNWGPVSQAVHQTFLASYRTIQPLTPTEAAWLPLLLCWHSLALAVGAVGGPMYAACWDAATLYLQ